ncbi:MAG: hypothetical protein QM645_04600 [Asticcacaulis sp.]
MVTDTQKAKLGILTELPMAYDKIPNEVPQLGTPLPGKLAFDRDR